MKLLHYLFLTAKAVALLALLYIPMGHADCSLSKGSALIFRPNVGAEINPGLDTGVVAPYTEVVDSYDHIPLSGSITCTSKSESYVEGFRISPGEAVGSDINGRTCRFRIPLVGGGDSGLAAIIWYNLKNTEEKPETYCMGYPAESNTFSAKKADIQGNFRLQIVTVDQQLRPGTLDFSSFQNNGIWWGSFLGASLKFDGVNLYVKPLSCDLQSTDITVPMGSGPGNEIDLSTFTGFYSTSAPVNFNIALNCDANTNISIIFKGDPALSDTSLLRLDNDTSSTVAQGLSIRIKTGASLGAYGNKAIPLNQFVTKPTTLMEKVSGGSVQIPLTAEYVQTGVTVTPGVADATATFQMLYP